MAEPTTSISPPITTQPTPLQLQDRVAVITGGSRGIGQAIAIHLASLGAKIVIADISKFENISIFPSGRAIAVKADITDPAQVKSIFDTTESVFGSPPNILVNSAGISDTNLLSNTCLESFDRIFAVNTRGSFLCCREAANRLKRGGGGRIICITSSRVASLKPCYGVYTASKAAVEAMVKIMAKELKGTGITANCVAPGPIATELFFNGKTEEMVNRVVEECPLKRLGQTDDVAAVVGFLAGDGGEWINGQTVRVNGGYV